MRLLLYTNLFPSEELPRHGIFVEERLRHLVATGHIDAKVCALRPRNLFRRTASTAHDGQGPTESRHGVHVTYVDVPTLPLVTNWIDPILWARASKKAALNLAGKSRSGFILEAHFLYPDAVAAVILARQMGVPVVMTARGSDVNIKCENPVMRRWVRWAAQRANAVVTVSQALADRLQAIGIAADKLHVLPNGVDLEKFRPIEDARSRAGLEEERTVLVSVGHLLEAKGHHIAIEALASLPGATLLIVGQGPREDTLRKLAAKCGVAARVRFLGHVPHNQLAEIYSAADFTILASENEGMPNVMLESLACGTRVIATDVGGVSEVITDSVGGAILRTRSGKSVVQSVNSLIGDRNDRVRTRLFSQRFAWQGVIQRQIKFYEKLL